LCLFKESTPNKKCNLTNQCDRVRKDDKKGISKGQSTHGIT